jgi:4-amino-4-deoxy-L-arabinose transferase-like glycosyltransferase
VRFESSRARRLAALALVLGLAAALRLRGIDYGIPHPTARPDEERLVGRAQHIFATSDWHPGSFYYPSLPFYLDALALHAYYGAKRLLGDYRQPFDFLFEIAVTRPGLHYRICRRLAAGAGIATVLAVCALSLSAYRRENAALLAAASLAVCHLHVRDSHFATVDVLMTLFVTLSLVFAVRAVEAPTASNFALAGALAGLAISSKYNAALVLLPIATAAILRWREARPRLALAALAAAAAFAATSPYLLLRMGTFWDDVSFLRDFLYRFPTGDIALWDHLRTTFPHGFGWPLFAASAGGLAHALWRRGRSDLVLLAFAVPFLILVSTVRITFPRYLLPVAPVLLVLASDLVAALARSRVSVMGAAAVLLLVPSLWSSFAFGRIAARDDTRLQAATFVSERFEPRTGLAVCRGYGAPVLNQDRRRPPAFAVDELDCLSEETPPEGTRFLITHEHRELSSFSRLHPSLARWLEENAEVAASFDPYRPGSDTVPVFYPADAFYIPFAGLDAVVRGGPLVRIWKIGER